MISIKKLAPGRLSRAIVARVARGGNRAAKIVNDAKTGSIQSAESGDSFSSSGEVATLIRQITITVETERVLIVSHGQSRSADLTVSPIDEKQAQPQRRLVSDESGPDPT